MAALVAHGAPMFASFAFAPRRGAPDWRAVLSLDPERFTSGAASAAELAALSSCGAQLRAAALEPDARLSDAANAARFARAASLLGLAAELDAAAAADDLRDAFDKLDALRHENQRLQARAPRRAAGRIARQSQRLRGLKTGHYERGFAPPARL